MHICHMLCSVVDTNMDNRVPIFEYAVLSVVGRANGTDVLRALLQGKLLVFLRGIAVSAALTMCLILAFEPWF